MKYYIFKVQDNLDQESYILNNVYIGYVGFDSQYGRVVLEKVKLNNFKSKGGVLSMGYREGKRVEHKYQLYAEGYSEDFGELHKLNCESTRFNKKEIKELLKKHPQLKLTKDKTWYKVYFPNRNSSESYLKEIDGTKTIK